jgi:dTDP-4-dehydrorhamnose 3,5-epimerase
MQVHTTPLAGLLVLEPKIFRDDRGWFFESFHQQRLAELGIRENWLQDNHSRSVQHTLRGLHFQKSPGQAKLVRCSLGEVWDVAVDIRPDSPTFGKWYGQKLSAENALQMFIPIGFAHGFLVLSEVAEVQYKCSWYYDGKTEAGIAWNDREIGVDWPLAGATPLLSKRDMSNPTLKEVFPNTSIP